MPRVIERRASEVAVEPVRGWILVEHPAAAPGWYRIRDTSQVPKWVTIECGRGAPYVVPAHKLLQWCPVEPPEIWWIPW